MNTIAGTITSVSVYVPITPEQCFYFGRECILNMLCKATECIIKNNSILINWIW